MVKRKTYKYTGVLARPIYVPLFISAALKPDDPTVLERASAAYHQQYTDRIAALFKDCGVAFREPLKWWAIALTLAERHVPGFERNKDYIRGQRERGRPKRERSEDLLVFLAITRRQAKGLSIRRAAQLVAAERGKGEKPSTLERRYRSLKGRSAELEDSARQKLRNPLSAAKR